MEYYITAEYQKAYELHSKIMANAEVAAGALLEMCRSLKEMRDTKLYMQFGISGFDEYCEQKVGIRARQAYTYISTYEKLGSTVLQSNANLGITKLELIAQLPALERAEELSNNTFDGMSVKEIRELVRKSKEQSEQFSILTEEKAKIENKAEQAEKKYFDLLSEQTAQKLESENRISELNRRIEELENQPVEVAVVQPSLEDMEKIRNKIRAEVQKENITQADIDKAVEAAIKKEKSQAKAKINKQLEKLKAEKEEMQRAAEASKNKLDELQKKIQISDPAKSKAVIYFEAMQQDYNNMISAIDEILSAADKVNFRKAVKKSLSILMKNLEL